MPKIAADTEEVPMILVESNYSKVSEDGEDSLTKYKRSSRTQSKMRDRSS